MSEARAMSERATIPYSIKDPSHVICYENDEDQPVRMGERLVTVGRGYAPRPGDWVTLAEGRIARRCDG